MAMSGERTLDFSEARAKLEAVVEQVGREVRVFLNPAAVPPHEDRQRPGAGSGDSAAIADDESDDFYEFTEADYARISRSRNEDVRLKTKKIRDAEAAASMSRISKAVVRTVFSDGWILEATFHPSDTVASVRQLLQRCIARPELPFYLYTTPPKQLIKDEAVSLYVAGLAPGALVHFAHQPPPGASPDQVEAITKGPFLREEVAALKNLHLIPEPERRHSHGTDGDAQAGGAASPVDAPSTPSVAPSVAKPGGKQPGRPKWFKPK